jgi:hypothetical protein
LKKKRKQPPFPFSAAARRPGPAAAHPRVHPFSPRALSPALPRGPADPSPRPSGRSHRRAGPAYHPRHRVGDGLGAGPDPEPELPPCATVRGRGPTPLGVPSPPIKAAQTLGPRLAAVSVCAAVLGPRLRRRPRPAAAAARARSGPPIPQPAAQIAPRLWSDRLIPVNPALSPAVDRDRWILIRWIRSSP